MNNEINKIAVWFCANKMSVNVDKTKYIIFSTRGKKIQLENAKLLFNANEEDQPYDRNLVYELERIHDNHNDKDKRTYKLLGINLDEYLSFNNHANVLCNKLSKSLYCINRAKNFLTVKTMRLLYFALINSHLTYCPIILNGMSQTNKTRIKKYRKKQFAL